MKRTTIRLLDMRRREWRPVDEKTQMALDLDGERLRQELAAQDISVVEVHYNKEEFWSDPTFRKELNRRLQRYRESFG